MDYLRYPGGCYSRRVRIHPDDDRLYTIRWFFAPKEAKLFPGWHSFASEVWRDDHSLPFDGIGEAEPERKFNRGLSDAYYGKCFVGKLEWFDTGMPVAELDKPAPPPSPCCKVPHGGTESGGTGTLAFFTAGASVECCPGVTFAPMLYLNVSAPGSAFDGIVMTLPSVSGGGWFAQYLWSTVPAPFFGSVSFACGGGLWGLGFGLDNPTLGVHRGDGVQMLNSTGFCGPGPWVVNPVQVLGDRFYGTWFLPDGRQFNYNLGPTPVGFPGPNGQPYVNAVFTVTTGISYVKKGTGGTASGGLGGELHAPVEKGSGGTESGGDGIRGHVGSGGTESGGVGLDLAIVPHVGTGGTESGGDGIRGHVGSGGTESGGVGLDLAIVPHVGSGGTESGGNGIRVHVGSGGTESGGVGLDLAIVPHVGTGGTGSGGDGILGGTEVGGRLLGIQRFTTPGSYTYTPTAGTNSVIIELVGGGGGGGGAASPGASTSASDMGAGGGGGAWLRKLLTANFSGATGVVGAGGAGGAAGAHNGTAGGDTTFITSGGSPTTYTAGGGSLGTRTGNVTGSHNGECRPGGTATGGDDNADGGYSSMSFSSNNASYGDSGGGGASRYSPGGAPASAGGINGSSAGTAATGNGGGGSGAVATQGGSSQAGGAGSGGLVLIWEYS